MDDDADDDLAAAAADLAASLEALRDDIAPRGPLGLPRPPRPAEVLRFAEGHAIPTAIAVLEANVRALEMLRAVLRLADPERSVREEVVPGESAATRAGAVGRETLRRADEALGELLSAVEDGALPPDAEARGVVEDARRLREQVEARLAELESGSGATAGDSAATVGDEPEGAAGDDTSAGDEPEGAAGDDTSAGDEPGATVDVEAELESIKAEVGEDEDGAESESDGAGAADAVDGEGTADEDGAGAADAATDADVTTDAAGDDATTDTDDADVVTDADDGDDEGAEPEDEGEAA